jgi:hypothetical protein
LDVGGLETVQEGEVREGKGEILRRRKAMLPPPTTTISRKSLIRNDFVTGLAGLDDPAAMRSGTIPNLIYYPAGRDNPASAREANRAPLVCGLECR